MKPDMPSEQEITDHPVIVQFFHSGKECVVKGTRDGKPVEVPWSLETLVRRTSRGSAGCSNKPVRKNRGRCGGCHEDDTEYFWKADHSRRLVIHKGECIGKDGTLLTAELAFWTEWEACTMATAVRKTLVGGTGPRWTHRLKTPLGKTGPHRVNTDPCVFGKTFKYCCCLQHVKNEKGKVVLRCLAPGSIILFGSRLKGRFVLDTVFVVGTVRVPYFEKTKSLLKVSDAYREMTLNRFTNRTVENTFYRGATFNPEARTTPYSFVPAKPFAEGNSRCGERFVLDLAAVNKCLHGSRERFNPESGKTQGFHAIATTKKTVVNVWSEILRQVRKDKFFPAVHFDWPAT